MDWIFGKPDEAGLSSAAGIRTLAPEPATPAEGLRLLRAFRAIACPRTRLRILALVDAEASRDGDIDTV